MPAGLRRAGGLRAPGGPRSRPRACVGGRRDGVGPGRDGRLELAPIVGMLGAHELVPPAEVKAVIVASSLVMEVVVRRGVVPAQPMARPEGCRMQLGAGVTHDVAQDLDRAEGA